MIEFAAECGLVLDEWQCYGLRLASGTRRDGSWAASQVGIDCPRQNGKGSVLEVRQLAGLFLLDRDLGSHTAHEYKTAAEHFRRMILLIEESPAWVQSRVKRIRLTTGEEAIELKSGARLRFLARSGGSGRGFSGDDIYLDEAMLIRGGVMAALRYAMRARPNHQIWLTGSAPLGRPESDEWRTLLNVAAEGAEKRMAFAGHSIDPEDAPSKTDSDPDRVLELAAVSNPALGIRIDPETVLSEWRTARASTDPDAWQDWLRETLGVPDPLPSRGRKAPKVPVRFWNRREDPGSEASGRLVFGVDVSPDRAWSSVGVVGRRPDGKGWHGEVVAHRPGTAWIVDRVVELLGRHGSGSPVVLDVSGPAGSLVAEFDDVGVTVSTVSSRGHAQACGLLYDMLAADPADGGGFWHLGQKDLKYGVSETQTAAYGRSGAWLWSPHDDFDLTPVKAVTLALGTAVGLPAEAQEPVFAY